MYDPTPHELAVMDAYESRLEEQAEDYFADELGETTEDS